MQNKSAEQKRAIMLIFLLIIMIICCLLFIVFRGNPIFGNVASTDSDTPIIADIYQDGVLLQSIPLHTVKETYTFTVTGYNGAENEIEVRPGSIGILSASCPDKLCVHQGFINTSLLPITCLPNRLVIQVRVEETSASNETNDITAY